MLKQKNLTENSSKKTTQGRERGEEEREERGERGSDENERVSCSNIKWEREGLGGVGGNAKSFEAGDRKATTGSNKLN